MAALIVSLVLSQTPVYTARPRYGSKCIAQCACLHPNFRCYSLRQPQRDGIVRLSWPGWLDYIPRRYASERQSEDWSEWKALVLYSKSAYCQENSVRGYFVEEGENIPWILRRTEVRLASGQAVHDSDSDALHSTSDIDSFVTKLCNVLSPQHGPQTKMPHTVVTNIARCVYVCLQPCFRTTSHVTLATWMAAPAAVLSSGSMRMFP